MNTDKLRSLAVSLNVAKNTLAEVNNAWDKEAGKCDHSQKGGDGLECSVGWKFGHEDPFCYAENCPLIKEG